MLVACILGKRIAEPAFFRKVYSRREAGMACSADDIRHWAKGMSFKCRAVCINPAVPKLTLMVSDSFTQRHTLCYKLLQHAVSLRGSRWKLLPRGTRKNISVEVKHIEHLKDVDDLVDVVGEILDPIEKQKCTLERVVLTNRMT